MKLAHQEGVQDLTLTPNAQPPLVILDILPQGLLRSDKILQFYFRH